MDSNYSRQLIRSNKQRDQLALQLHVFIYVFNYRILVYRIKATKAKETVHSRIYSPNYIGLLCT